MDQSITLRPPMNEQVKVMLATPGRHCVTTNELWPEDQHHGVYSVVEVEADGTCHQLNPKGERDGVLSPEGWRMNTRVIGPTLALSLGLLNYLDKAGKEKA